MTSSRGRPPNRPDVARPTSTRELESSNSTTAAFLGGKQKDWMGGRKPSQQALSTTRSNIQPPAEQPNAFNLHKMSEASFSPDHDRGRFPAQRRRRGGTQTYPSRKNASLISSTISSATPPQMAGTCSPVETSKDLNGNVGNLLPSPSPSIETRRQSTTIVDLEDDPHASGNELRTRLEELVAQHGGIDAIEKKLQNVECPNSHLAQPVTSPPLVSNFQDNRPTNTTTDAEPSAPYPDETEPSYSPPVNIRAEPAATNQPSGDVQGFNERVQIPSEFIFPTSGPTLSSPVGPTSDDSQNATVSFEAEMQNFNRKASDRLLRSNMDSRPGNGLERPRLNLLREACERSDCFYLCLHQLYVRDFIRKRLSELSLDTSYQGGLDKLSFLLVPNENLSADAIKWFADFPLPLESLLSGRPAFQSAHGKVLKCLIQLGMNFDIIRSQCAIRGYPPLVDELFRLLNAESFTLQQVIFRAILREIWRGPQDRCYQHAEEIFSRYCKDGVLRRSTNPGVHRTEANSPAFIREYSQISLLHQEHTQQQTVANMPPPQQGHNGSLPPSHPETIHGPRVSRHSRNNPQSSSLNIDTQSAQQTSQSHLSTPMSNPSATASSRPIFPSGQGYPISQSPPSATSPLQQGAGYSRPGTALPGFYNQIAHPNRVSQRHSQSSTMSQSLPANPQVLGSLPSELGRHSVQPFHRTLQMQGVLPANVSHQGANRSQQNYGQQSEQPVQVQSSATQSRTRPLFPQMSSSEMQRNQHNTARQTQGSVINSTQFIRANPHLSQAQANPNLNALHQAHVRSPTLSTPAIQSINNNRGRLFRYIKHVNMSPGELSSARKYISWAFEVDKAMSETLVKDTPGSYGAAPTRILHGGSCLCRVRCIKANRPTGPLSESEWAIADNVWPGSTAIILNGTPLEIRKKSHHGKDLPIDATPYIKEGVNNITISIIGLPEGSTNRYAIGIEIIEVIDEQSIKNNIPTLPWQEARQRIMNRSSNNDPDVQVVNSLLVLDLTDPFMASLFEVPVRGTSCLHNQCFDRDIFLQTRNSKITKDPCGPDEFRCPICGSDARPQSLLIDGYFVQIREELRQQGRLDVKTVILHPYGDWEIKEEEEVTGEQGDGSGGKSLQATRRSVGRQSTPRDVIQIDDDE